MNSPDHFLSLLDESKNDISLYRNLLSDVVYICKFRLRGKMGYAHMWIYPYLKPFVDYLDILKINVSESDHDYILKYLIKECEVRLGLLRSEAPTFKEFVKGFFLS